MADPVLNTRDAKLASWLLEAHRKEAELEADLKAHIALTDKQSHKKRLQRHLTETRDHKKRVARRVKQLGVSVDTGLPLGPVTQLTGKTVAALKGQAGAASFAVSRGQRAAARR